MNFNSELKVLPKKIIIVDGYSASGKGALCKYIQSFSNVEKMCVDHIFQEIAYLNHFNHLPLIEAKYFFKIKLNVTYENYHLSRDLNFRPFDDSSIFQSGKSFEYIKRLLNKDGDNVTKIIKKNNSPFLLMNHFSLPFVNFFFETLGINLKFISIVRHPVYQFKHWIYLLQSISKKNNRIHKFLFEYKNKLFFWFENPKISNKLNLTERFISAYLNLNKLSKIEANKIDLRYKNNFKIINFENFTMNTNSLEKELTDFLNIDVTSKTENVKKKLNLNQKYFSEREFIRSSKGWYIKNNIETQKNFEDKLNTIKMNSNKKLFSKFVEECYNYEKNFNLSSLIYSKN